ncbi:OmpA family protein [Fibrella arboris]|uniref:OmpA family protein n=1 Tax=Fibrella arboris TaxID=3242486 RepID=UPI0035219B15
MVVNILDTAKGYLTDAVVSRMSGWLNEDPDTIQKGLSGALPVFLGGLITRSQEPGGLGAVTSLIEQSAANSAVASSLEATGETDEPAAHIQDGGDLLEAVFGAKTNQVNQALAQFSGVSSSLAGSLLQVAGSLITNLLGRQLLSGSGSITTDSVQNLLADQQESISAALPSGLATLPGDPAGAPDITGLLGDLSGAASSPVTGAASAVGAALAGAASGAGPVLSVENDVTPPASAGLTGNLPGTPAYSDDLRNSSKSFNFWPWLLAALAIGVLFYTMRGCGDTTDPVTISTTNDTTSASVQDATANQDSAATSAGALVDSAGSSIAAAADSAAKKLVDATAALGTFGPRKLPNGVELTLPANGVENKLLAFIEDPSKEVDKTTWFDFDRLLYETGSAALKPESREQLQNMAAILKAYPAVNLKIGGYTDNTGNAAANKKLSQSRAEAAMTELVRLGVDPSRLEAEGYGQEHPVASNRTEEGRAQNRRTAVRVTKK